MSRRAKKLIKVTRGSLEATAPTKIEANKLLAQMIDGACTYHPPHVEQRLGHVIVVARTCFDWHVTVVEQGDNTPHRPTWCSRGSGATFNTVLQGARLHAAQSTFDPLKTFEAMWDVLDHAELDEEHERQFWSWLVFQETFREARDRGATLDQAHHIGGGLHKMPPVPKDAFYAAYYEARSRDRALSHAHASHIASRQVSDEQARAYDEWSAL